MQSIFSFWLVKLWRTSVLETTVSEQSVDWDVKSPIYFEYKVKLCNNCFDLEDDFLASFSVYDDIKERLLIVDDGLPTEFIQSFKNYLKSFGQEAVIIRFLTNENTKNLDLLLSILSEIEKFGVPRRGNPILALGGGVLLDTVGFAASMYRRGVPYIKIPTTLLSLVDTAIGIKTSVNHFGRRNRIGSFYPGIGAVISPIFLKTLPVEHFSYGLAEIIKIAIVKSQKLFELLENNQENLLDYKFYDTDEGLKVIQLACHYMLEELAPNLTETNLERLVDFGHTFSPIPEMKSLEDNTVHELAHGEAVFLDVIFTSCMGQILGHTNKSLVKRIINLGKHAGLPISHPYFNDPMLLFESSNDAKKHRAGSVNLPVPCELEQIIFLENINFSLIEETVKIMQVHIDE